MALKTTHLPSGDTAGSFTRFRAIMSSNVNGRLPCAKVCGTNVQSRTKTIKMPGTAGGTRAVRGMAPPENRTVYKNCTVYSDRRKLAMTRAPRSGDALRSTQYSVLSIQYPVLGISGLRTDN